MLSAGIPQLKHERNIQYVKNVLKLNMTEVIDLFKSVRSKSGFQETNNKGNADLVEKVRQFHSQLEAQLRCRLNYIYINRKSLIILTRAD